MTKMRKATFRCYVIVEFEEDESEDALIVEDQAFEELELQCGEFLYGIELVEVE